jgi:hypothetical protein
LSLQCRLSTLGARARGACPSDEIAGQRELLSRLRVVVEAKDAKTALLWRELDAEREPRRRLELRLAELERRLPMHSSYSGTPSSKERIEARRRRRARQQSERERRRDRKRREEKEKTAAGAPHVLIIRTPDGRLTWLQALGSRRKGDVAAGIPAGFTALLMTDGQPELSRSTWATEARSTGRGRRIASCSSDTPTRSAMT